MRFEEQTEAAVARRRKRDREATRRRILDAARDLFGEHGYDGVTVRMIAGRAEANTRWSTATSAPRRRCSARCWPGSR